MSRHGGRAGNARAVLSWAPTVAVAAGALATARPDALGLADRFGMAQIVALRGLAALGLTGAAAALGATAAVRARKRPAPRRLVAASAFGLAAALHAGTVVSRGWRGQDRPGRCDLVVVTFNTQRMAATVAEVASLVDGCDAAVVVLPETPRPAADRIAAAMLERGARYEVFHDSDGPDEADTVSLLVHASLGPYRQVETPYLRHGAVRVESAAGASLGDPDASPPPTLIGVHPGAPVRIIGPARWRAQLATAAGLGESVSGPAVLAGDYNATIDHGPLRRLTRCLPAAGQVRRGAAGTWPAWLPPPLAAPIDHILVSPDFRVLGVRVQRVGRSDHRALIARLQRLPG